MLEHESNCEQWRIEAVAVVVGGPHVGGCPDMAGHLGGGIDDLRSDTGRDRGGYRESE